MRSHIIFEDNHIIAAVKPVNIPSQKDKSNDPDMLTILKQYIREKYNKPGKVYLGLLHRLDRPAGGIMVFAKTSKAASRISREMRAGRLKKIYLCVIHGRLKKPSGSLEHFLLKERELNTVKLTEVPVNNAKKALLTYEEIEYFNGFSLIRVSLLTGRPHQIRAQFAGIGHPLWGDLKYGSNLSIPGQQLALWSAEISFKHPVSGEDISFTSRPPLKKPWNYFMSLIQENP